MMLTAIYTLLVIAQAMKELFEKRVYFKITYIFDILRIFDKIFKTKRGSGKYQGEAT